MQSNQATRRGFLGTAALGGAATLTGGLAFMSELPIVTADETKLPGNLVQLGSAVEPLVKLIETTPRGALLEKVAHAIHRGRSYRDVLAALLLAGVRNVQPRPAVGFKFHCVLVVNSCHLASIAGPDEDRWLPIFWALDYFKSSQADEARRSGWRMNAVNEAMVPAGDEARALFVDAMDSWDVEQADAATAGIVRSLGATDVFNLFARYAARDYRSIGHKAIYLANAWRTLQVIGWQFAEPVLRSLAFALLNHAGEANPAESDHRADRPWRENVPLLAKIPPAWLSGRLDHGVPTELFQAFRSEEPTVASTLASEALAKGVGPQSIWDGVFVGAAELLSRQPGIIGLHGLTTANAMHYLYANAADPALRQRILLQACAFNAMFRESAKGRGKLADRAVEDLTAQKVADDATAALSEIAADISDDRWRAASKLRAYLDAGGSCDAWIAHARRLLFVKGRDAHDYKFTSAVLEDAMHLSEQWRNPFVSLSVYNLRGSGHADNQLVERTRAALAG